MIKYLLTAIIFVLLDSLYLNMIKNYFNSQIKLIQGSEMKVKILPASITYIFLVFGLLYFIIQKNRSISDAAILGLIIYAVYELTSYALFDKWSIFTVIIDTLWGSFLFGFTTYIVYKIYGIV